MVGIPASERPIAANRQFLDSLVVLVDQAGNGLRSARWSRRVPRQPVHQKHPGDDRERETQDELRYHEEFAECRHGSRLSKSVNESWELRPITAC